MCVCIVVYIYYMQRIICLTKCRYPIFSHCTCRRLYRGTKVPLYYIYMVFSHVICFCSFVGLDESKLTHL